MNLRFDGQQTRFMKPGSLAWPSERYCAHWVADASFPSPLMQLSTNRELRLEGVVANLTGRKFCVTVFRSNQRRGTAWRRAGL